MAKQACTLCGKEVGLFQQQKLADGHYICRDECGKKAMKYFDLVHATIYDLTAHLEQVERGTALYEKLFAPRQKTLKHLAGSSLDVAEDMGLIALVEVRYKKLMFGKSVHACVYRIADLYGYECEEIERDDPSSDRAGVVKRIGCTHFYFLNTPGMHDFVVELSSPDEHRRLEKYFDSLFGIQRTLGNVGNTWKNQIAALKAAGNLAKAAVGGGNVEAALETTAGALDVTVYGNRSEWIARAEAALQGT